MSRSYRLEELARILGGSLRIPSGSESASAILCIRGVADVRDAESDEITWVANSKYAGFMKKSRAGAVLCTPQADPFPIPTIECERLEPAVAKLLGAFTNPPAAQPVGAHPSSIVHDSARLADRVSVGPFVVISEHVDIGPGSAIHSGAFIGPGVRIGADCIVGTHVVIEAGCVLGNRVVIHPNAVIGKDGFGFFFNQDHLERFPHGGGVLLGDDVEIGACCCVDRSKFGNTTIHKGSKIDNLTQVAHNVRIGANTVVAGLTGIAGSARIGDGCVIAGGVLFADNVTIGDQVRVAMSAGVTKDVASRSTVSGFPAQPHRQELKDRAVIRRIPELLEEIRQLSIRVKQLEASAHHQP